MKTLTILFLLHMTICLHAATRTIEAPDYMPLYERGIVIEKVKFEEDCTTVFFGTRGKGTAQLLQSICLTDEQGNRYKAQWEITQQWNPTALPLPQQKPLAITKQKPDKERTIKNRNAERLKNKGR